PGETMEVNYADSGHPQPANKVEDIEAKPPTFPTTQEFSTTVKKESSPIPNAPSDMPSQGPPPLVNEDRGRDRESGSSRPRPRSRSPHVVHIPEVPLVGVFQEEKDEEDPEVAKEAVEEEE
ncbi:704_t:CDS:2, partial [Scutellospora calospora]